MYIVVRRRGRGNSKLAGVAAHVSQRDTLALINSQEKRVVNRNSSILLSLTQNHYYRSLIARNETAQERGSAIHDVSFCTSTFWLGAKKYLPCWDFSHSTFLLNISSVSCLLEGLLVPLPFPLTDITREQNLSLASFP